ncbi:hypothetical protein [Flavisolibacter tropicus]|uniref:Uncharacterized protein n=1 Tax=Flavisolibacter tropicus TaxID=1492898 RepID=A0A172U0S0_9BACT|nr:hypothetical protein [Flavisolibacter tropicus]ANE52822.1 hypothetical protein SY85_22445 [Flavisolibacter tropicus]
MRSIALLKPITALLFFFFLTSLIHAQVSSSALQINSLFQKIQAENRYVGSFKESDLASLPVGIAKEINGKQYLIVIDSARFTTHGAFFNVYAQLNLPGTDETLAFAARNVSFNPGGISVSSGARLELVSEHSIKISEKVKLVLPTSANYIEWDCNGFKSVNLKGVFEFARDFLEPLSDQEQVVKADFQINAKDLNNILVRVDMSPFTLAGLKDFGFEVQEAVVDLSDIANPEEMIMANNEEGALWRGFYLKELNVWLPKEFSNDKGVRPTLHARDLVIDNRGMSGRFGGSNLIPLGNASASGWPLSVELLEVQLQHNRIKSGGLKGKMNIPFLGDDPLAYEANVGQRENDVFYSFALQTTKEKKYDFFAGELILASNSEVKIEKYKGQFVASAVLHGSLDIAKGVFKAPGIRFQDLTLSSEKPYVHKGYLSVDGNVGFKLGSFKCGLDSIRLGLVNGELAVSSKVRLNLMDEADKSFSAETRIKVISRLSEEKQLVTKDGIGAENTKLKWTFDKLKVDEISLTCKSGAFELDGTIALYENDPVYGTGFKGKIAMQLPVIKRVEAHAWFGSTDEYRYWHVDAFVPTHIPIAPTLEIRRVLGGLSYHMERPAQFDPFQSMSKDSVGLQSADALLTYTPSREAGLGFLAGATIATKPSADVFNGDAMFEVSFSTSGGFRYAQFDGTGFFFSDVAKLGKEKPNGDGGGAPVFAKLYMRYDNTNKSFHASVKTYVNILGSIKGVGERGLVGEAVLHFDPNDWWIYIGRPSQMMGLDIANLAVVKGYFMVGTKVENMPLPPSEVTNLFDFGNGDFMEKENALSTGRGFGFGAHFRTDFGFGKDGGFLYAYLGVGAGADILLRDYGEARCKGGNGPIGVNGWYASGQAYAFLQGRVGIRVKVMGSKKEFDIINLAAAALLQAKLPNPSWFRGAVGVRYSVLGGLVKGKVTVKVELGSQCEVISGKEIDVKVINDIRPDNASNDVSVFAAPQVAFNIPVEKPFSMMNNEDVVTTYQIKLDEFTLVDKKAGSLKGSLEWHPNKDAATLNFLDILPPSADLSASVKVHIEKWTGSSWVPLSEGGKVDYETKTVSFRTGEAPSNIPEENIAYSYPVHQQYNFYTNEYGRGYFKLKRGQPYLFNQKDNNGSWKYYVRFQHADGTSKDVPVTYNATAAQLDFDIPSQLKTESVYSLIVIKAPADGVASTENVAVRSTTVQQGEDSTSINEKVLKGVATAATETSLLDRSFRTSKYLTFRDKMNAAGNSMDLFDIAQNYITVVGKRYDIDETFDRFELAGIDERTQPLVFAKANTNNSWLQNKLIPLLYQSYPLDNTLTIEQRDVKKLGTPPLGAVSVFNNDPALYQLSGEDVNAGTPAGKAGRFRIMYFLSYIGNQDYHELLEKAVNKYLSTNALQNVMPQSVQYLFRTPFQDLESNQSYQVEVNYRLPGTNTITTSITCNILFR